MKCKVCGTEHRGIPKHGGYCLDHQEQRAEAAEAQRNTAWTELNEIRAMLHADENEATVDEVRRVMNEASEKVDNLLEANREQAEALATLRAERDDALSMRDKAIEECEKAVDERDYQARRVESLHATLITVNNERDALRRQLEKAQDKIAALSTQLGSPVQP